VLNAFQQVEDGLTLSASLQAQNQDQFRAVTAANRAMDLTEQLYIGGINNYLDVVVAQQTALLAEIAARAGQNGPATGQREPDPRCGRRVEHGRPADGARRACRSNPLDVIRIDRPRPDGTEPGTGAASEPLP